VADNESMKYPALKHAKIPHEVVISNALLPWLLKIAEARPFLDEYLGTPQELKLLRRAKIKAVTYSNQIEGNQLDELEVTAVLQGRRVTASPHELKEIGNYRTALEYVEKLASDQRIFKQADFRDIQRLVTHGLLPEKQSGRIRTIPVSIINSGTGEKIEDCPEPHFLKDLLDELWLWLEENEEIDPFLRAFAFHYIAVAIHPFADGNGRSVRLAQHLLLLKGGQRIARMVPSETVIMRQRDRYYASIRQSRALGSLNPLLEFLAECFAIAAQEVVAEGKSLLRNNAILNPTGRHDKIMSFAKRRKIFSMGEIVTLLPDVPRRTLERDVATLVQEGLLVAKGEKKARVYRIKA
jgi:Fic family protein